MRYKTFFSAQTFLTTALAALLFSGCGGREPEVPVARAPGVNVEWLGHNSFRIQSELGTRLVTDPFNPNYIRYPQPENLRADILLISHEDSCCNYSDLVVNAPQTFRSAAGVGSNSARGILIRGEATHADPSNPTLSGLNTVYSWTMDGIRFCFLGSIKDPLPAEEARRIGPVDILFLPVGGPRQLTDSDRNRIIEQLQPRIIVPMGYGTRYTQNLDLGRVEQWLVNKPNVVRLSENRFRVSKDNLPAERTIMVPALPGS